MLVSRKQASPMGGAKRVTLMATTALFFAAAMAGTAYARHDHSGIPLADNRIETLLQIRKDIPSDALEEAARADHDLFFAYRESGLKAKATVQAKILESWISQPISDIEKSFIFRDAFEQSLVDHDYENALEVLALYKNTKNFENEAIKQYSLDVANGILYKKLGYHQRSLDTLNGVFNNPEYQSLEIYKTDYVINRLCVAESADALKDGAASLAYVELAEANLSGDNAANKRFSGYQRNIFENKIARARGNALIRVGRPQEAIIEANTMIKRSETHGLQTVVLDAYRILGIAHYTLDNNDKAEEYFLKIAEHKLFSGEGRNDAGIYTYLGYIAEKRGNPTEALAFYRQAIPILEKWRTQRASNRVDYLTAESLNSQRQKEIAELKAENIASASAARRNRNLAVFGGMSALLALLALGIAYGSYRTQKIAHDKLDKYADELKKSEARANQNAEQAKSASEAKTAFLANMSHEIRTPMNGVLGMAQILSTSELNAQQKEYAEAIHTSGSALLTVIDDILDFSKIEAGKLELDPSSCNLRTTIEDVAAIMAPPAAEKEIEILVRYAPNVPECILADSGRLRQVMMNLVGNAVKFTQEGHVLINVQGNAVGGNAELKIEVLDTGIGIPPHRIDAIFDDFNQAEATTTRRYGGTGLGLAITRRLIEAMNGTLDVKSRYNFGSIFSLNFSFPISTDASPQLYPKLCTKNMRVLIVDDMELNRHIYAEQLRSWNIQYETADSGRVAYDKVVKADRANKAFDLLIIDQQMPGLDGEQLASAIRAAPEINAPRIIMLTYADSNSQKAQSKTLAISANLTKPVRSSTLYYAIEDAMSRQIPIAEDVDSAVDNHVAAPSPLHSQTADTTQTETQRILIAEDNEINRRVITAFLKDSPFEIAFAVNGKDALAQATTMDFDLIFMDVSMPEMDGMEASKAIREHEAAYDVIATPIICLSAHVMEESKIEAAEAGMDDYLSKPLLKEKLIEAIETWITVKRDRIRDNTLLFDVA